MSATCLAWQPETELTDLKLMMETETERPTVAAAQEPFVGHQDASPVARRPAPVALEALWVWEDEIQGSAFRNRQRLTGAVIFAVPLLAAIALLASQILF